MVPVGGAAAAVAAPGEPVPAALRPVHGAVDEAVHGEHGGERENHVEQQVHRVDVDLMAE